MKRVVRTVCNAAIAVALCGCTSLDEGARQELSKAFTCPESSITVTERSDLDADELRYGPTPAPPADVAADPTRRALWDKQHQRTKTGHVVYQAVGCDHEVFYSCGRSKKNHPMCFATDYHSKKPATPLPTLATLASASLDSPSNLIDAPGMVGDLESFDADANLYWVSSIASAWSPDAKLYFIRVTRPSPGGTVDLSAKGLGGVLYQFNSSSRGDVDFNVDVGSLRGQRKPPLSVSTSKHADGTPRNAIAKPKCTLVSALAKARAGVLATADPKYGLDFTLESDGANTSWTTTAVLAGKSQWVRIDATKCEVEKRDAGK